jgi:hypothetical protein
MRSVLPIFAICALSSALMIGFPEYPAAAGSANSLTQEASAPRYVTQAQSGPTMREDRGPMCAWVPVRRVMQTPQCGYNDFSIPNPGVFDCGLVRQGNACVQRCFFVRCGN